MSASTFSEEELNVLKDSAASFAADVSDLEEYRRRQGGVPAYREQVFEKMVEMGWTAMTVPEPQGGLGLGVEPAGILVQELAGRLCAEPLVDEVFAATALLGRCPPGPVVQELLQGIAEGKFLVGLAYQESPSFEIQSPKTQAARRGDGFALTGTKDFVPPSRDGWLVPALCDDVPGIFFVAADADGLSVSYRTRVDGVASATLDLHAAMARGPLTQGEHAEAALRHAVDTATVLKCAELLGVMSAAMEITLEYLRTREQFDRPIGSFQSLQHGMVDLYIQRELAISAYQHALEVFESAAEASAKSKAISRAKARCSDAGLRITRGSIQYHGAIGFTDACDIGLYLKRAVALATANGNATFHRKRFGELCLADGA